MVARALDAWWHELGRPIRSRSSRPAPDRARSPGPCSAPTRRVREALRYVAVEVSAAQRERHPDGVESVAEMPLGPFVGVILANELLDNLPFRLAVFDGVWREAFVAVERGTLRRGARRTSSSRRRSPAGPAVRHGARVPLQDSAGAWVVDARSAARPGAARRHRLLHAARPRSSPCVRGGSGCARTAAHERGAHYLAIPGTQDITAEVALDQLAPPPASPTRSAPRPSSCGRWGIDELVDEGTRVWAEHAARPDLHAMTMRSRISEAEALLDPTGLGVVRRPRVDRRLQRTYLTSNCCIAVRGGAVAYDAAHGRPTGPNRRGRGEASTGRAVPATARCRTPALRSGSPRRPSPV